MLPGISLTSTNMTSMGGLLLIAFAVLLNKKLFNSFLKSNPHQQV